MQEREYRMVGMTRAQSQRVVLMLLGCSACSTNPGGPIDVCEALARGPDLVGQQVVIAGWYADRHHWQAIGSPHCREQFIEPNFVQVADVTFENKDDPLRPKVLESIASGLPLYGVPDFHGHFTGIWRKRSSGGGDFGLSVADAPYVFEISAIANIRFEKAKLSEPITKREIPPPPPPSYKKS